MHKKVLALIFSFLFFFSVFTGFELAAQSIDNIQFPPSVEWKKIDTKHFTLLFPENLEAKAADIASMLESYYDADEYSLETAALRWPIIINNTLVNPNAYVMGAPRHSQLYTIPAQEGFHGTSNWLELIWSHELRHIVQNDKMLRGFTAFAHWLAGEYGSSGMSHFALPSWLWEGDAVLTETLLSSGGRGRSADFERGLRTDVLNGVKHNYYKASLGYYGSYREQIPSWYVMGYHLCTYIRKEFGIEAFNRILEISADFSFAPLILNIAVKKVTGITIEEVYSDCLDDLQKLWAEQSAEREISDAALIKSADASNNANYYPLGSFDDGETAALKTSSDDIPTLVRIDHNGEERILRRISPFDKNISFNGSAFCWIESRPDARWGNRSWTEIRLYNPESGEYRLVTDKTRYLSASLSPDGAKIAAVEITAELDSFIVIIDADSGRVLRRIPEPSNASPSQTCWTDDGNGIVYVRQQDWMESLRLLTPDDNKNISITEPSVFNISSPAVMDGEVYFVSEKSGLDNIHRISISGGKESVSVSRPYGTARPAAGEMALLFADYGTYGWAIASIPQEQAEASELSLSESGHIDYFDGLQQQEARAGMSGPGISDDTEETSAGVEYEIRDYAPAIGLFNFHSRSFTTSRSGTGLAVSLQADDILNYSSGSIYAGWDPETGEILTGTAGTWAGLYPVLLYGAELQAPAQAFGSKLDSNIYGGLWLPLNFSSGIISHSLSLQEIIIWESELISRQNALASQSSIAWRLTRNAAKRDIIPPLGISVSGMWYSTIVPAYYNLLSASTEIYLPGLITNHGLQLGLSADYNHPSAVENLPPEHIPRGYSASDFSNALMLGGSIDYSLPLLYPDFAVGGFMYIPRIYLNCFIDAAAGWKITPEEFEPPAVLLSTTGIEFFTDFHLFNNIQPLRAGLRFIYDLKNGGIRIEETTLLIGIDIL